MQVKRGLGKGLGALIDEADQTGVVEIDVLRIEPNKHQPRKHFDEQSLTELANSMAEYGVIQPLILKEEKGYYSIIAGERRWRAARMAKLAKVPAIIKDYTPSQTLQIALIENIQRQDLNPIEEAMCYKRLIDDFFYSQEDIAAKIGKSRNSVSYSMSLLALEPPVMQYIIEGKLTAAHGRALLALNEGQAEYAEIIANERLSAREAERMIASLNDKNQDPAQKLGKHAHTAVSVTPPPSHGAESVENPSSNENDFNYPTDDIDAGVDFGDVGDCDYAEDDVSAEDYAYETPEDYADDPDDEIFPPAPEPMRHTNDSASEAVVSSAYKNAEDELKTILGTKVSIKNNKNKGKIEIEYYSDDELDRLLCFFKGLGR